MENSTGDTRLRGYDRKACIEVFIELAKFIRVNKGAFESQGEEADVRDQ